MATDLSPSASDAAILARLIRPEENSLSVEAAEGFLAIRFEPSDLDRIRELVAKNQVDGITPEERAELGNYRRVSFLLDLLHSKARRALKIHGAPR